MKVSFQQIQKANRRADYLYELLKDEEDSLDRLVGAAVECYANDFFELDDYVVDFGKLRNESGFLCDQVYGIITESKSEKACLVKLKKIRTFYNKNKGDI